MRYLADFNVWVLLPINPSIFFFQNIIMNTHYDRTKEKNRRIVTYHLIYPTYITHLIYLTRHPTQSILYISYHTSHISHKHIPWSDSIRSSIRANSDPPRFRNSLEDNPYRESVASTNAAARASFDRWSLWLWYLVHIETRTMVGGGFEFSHKRW